MTKKENKIIEKIEKENFENKDKSLYISRVIRRFLPQVEDDVTKNHAKDKSS